MLNARVAVLVSGGGTNLQALLDAQEAGRLRSGTVVLALSSRSDARALARARARGVRAEAVPFHDFDSQSAFEERMLELLDEERIDVVVLAGFLRVLSGAFVARYRGRMLNVHPSLIPAFCGRGLYGTRVHKAALTAGVKVTGATVHLVDETPDGGPILAQRAVEVLPDDTPETLQRRVMEQAEWRILPEATESLCQELGALPRTPPRERAPLDPSISFLRRGEAPPQERSTGVQGNLFPCRGARGAEPPGFRQRPQDLAELLRANRYPGRGIVLGCAPDDRVVLAYFIMGRSASSRARRFEREGDDLVIRLLDGEKVADPSLILYAPVRVCGPHIVVSNGDQTETIRESLRSGGTFEAALRTRRYEPDAPHFTPRVSALLSFAPRLSYRLSILKAGEGSSCLRQFFEYEPIPGVGRLIHTYEGDGDPLPSFAGEPRAVRIPADLETFANSLWEALDEKNRVALYVRAISPNGVSYQNWLFNQKEGAR